MSCTEQLSIDECEDWIGQILCCSKGFELEHIIKEKYEYLSVKTNTFYIDRRSLEKIKKITNMVPVNIVSDGDKSRLWFARLRK